MSKSALSEGFTLLELLIVMAILGILMSIGYFSYLKSINPPREMARSLQAYLLQMRTDAMANTQAQRLLLSGQDLLIQTAFRCSETDATKWQNAGSINFDDVQRKNTVTLSTADPTGSPDPSLPTGAKLVTCFTSRGLAQAAAGQTIATLNISDSRRTYKVDIALGGAVRTRAN